VSGQYSSIEVAVPAMVVASPTRQTYIARGINVMDRFTNWIRTPGLTSAVQVRGVQGEGTCQNVC
jgi:hypothetical protein